MIITLIIEKNIIFHRSYISLQEWYYCNTILQEELKIVMNIYRAEWQQVKVLEGNTLGEYSKVHDRYTGLSFTVPGIIGSLQALEAIKIATGNESIL